MKNNLQKTVPQEVIIVEGKSDTQKLKTIFGSDIQTIETKGLALTKQTIALIEQINQEKGVIIFTDPDGPGKKIRQTLNDQLTGEVKNAFITKDDIEEKSKKIGIAEGNQQAIIHALNNLMTFKKYSETLSWQEYLDQDFYLKESRLIFCKYFKFDAKMSSKTLFKWFNLMGLTQEKLQLILEEGKNKENGQD